MPEVYYLFADINRWLDEHPLVLGLGSLTLGILAGGWSLWELKTGRYKQREAPEFRKNQLVKVLGGAMAFLGFGIYVLIAR